jgi:hypothetical protein
MSRYSAYCLLRSAFCLLLTAFRPSRDTGTIASIIADIGYVFKKFMYSRGNNFCFRKGMDSLSESKRGRGPSRSHGHRLCAWALQRWEGKARGQKSTDRDGYTLEEV